MTKLNKYLAYAGTLPFIVCALLLIFNINLLFDINTLKMILSSYGLIIISFMAGSHWGEHLHIQAESWGLSLPILSNVIALAAWFSWLILVFRGVLLVYIGLFLALMVVDYYLHQQHLISHAYYRTRCIVTAIVIATLMIMGVCA